MVIKRLFWALLGLVMSPSSAWTSWQGWCEARGIQRNQGSGGFPLSLFWRFLNCLGERMPHIFLFLFGGGVCIYLHSSQNWKIGTSKKNNAPPNKGTWDLSNQYFSKCKWWVLGRLEKVRESRVNLEDLATSRDGKLMMVLKWYY